MQLRQLIIRQSLLPIRDRISVSARSILTTVDGAGLILGEENETLNDMAYNGAREDHLRFVFDVGAGNRKVAELRFWTRECEALKDDLKSGARHPNFTFENALQEIIGVREYISRGELGVQWRLSSNLLTDLIRDGALSLTGNRLLRATLENFLRKRWIGGAQ
jgi:hypothetical protein